MKTLAQLANFNTRLVGLGFDDLNDEQLHYRAKVGTSIAYFTGHILSSRMDALVLLGEAAENPYRERFASNTQNYAGPVENASQLMDDWAGIGERFEEALASLGEELAAAPYCEMPLPDQTIGGAMTFSIWHETFHIGQISSIRIELGMPSLKDRLHEKVTSKPDLAVA